MGQIRKKYFQARQRCLHRNNIIYLSPENSSMPYIRRQQCDLFSILETEIARFMVKGTVMITGDLNARTSNQIDYIECDKDKFIPTPCDYLPDKQNEEATYVYDVFALPDSQCPECTNFL